MTTNSSRRTGKAAGAALLTLALLGAWALWPRGGASRYIPLELQEAHAQGGAPLAVRAHDIIKEQCGGCHVKNFKFNATDYKSVTAKYVVPGKPEASRLFQLLDPANGKLMPEGGFEGKEGQPLPAAMVSTIKDWIAAGAPDWTGPSDPTPIPTPKPTPRTFVTEKAALTAISKDLQGADENSRRFLRYFSIHNLYNNTEVEDKKLELYRTTLSKAVNHLSRAHDISKPKAIDAANLIYRIDVRDFNWSRGTWSRIIAQYPYGFKPRQLRGEVDTIRNLSEAELPYVRVDWFIANALVPPLYHEILELPDTVAELERRLEVDARRDVEDERVIRAGLLESGVSKHNRAVERHPSRDGYYWKSFDFATSDDQQNIFRHPLDFKENGGEFIFSLPNGLQAYMIATADGKRLDTAPPNIVFDREHKNDNPLVVNGFSCISCHAKGMNTFADEVRANIELQHHIADIDHALELYKPQTQLNAAFKTDNVRFQEALAKTGSELPDTRDVEPITVLSGYYAESVSSEQAGAECGLKLPEFLRLVGRSRLADVGLGTLEKLSPEGKPIGKVKREVWEKNFALVVEELNLGEYLAPKFHARIENFSTASTDNSHALQVPTVSIGQLDGANAAAAAQALRFYFDNSRDVRVVPGRGDYNLKGTLLVRGRDTTLQVGDPGRQLLESATGPADDINFVAQQVANQVHFRISGNWLPVATTQTAASGGAAASAPPVDPVTQLQNLGAGGPINLSLGVGKGPGSTYHFGEKVTIAAKADRDCFLTVYNIDSQNNVNLIFPNEFFRNNFVRGGQLINLPCPDGSCDLTAEGVPGQEIVSAVATLTQIALPGVGAQPQLGEVGKGLTAFSKSLGKSLGVHRTGNAGSAGTSPPSNATTAVLRFFTVR